MKFNYHAPRESMLLEYAKLGLSEKIDTLPDFTPNNTYEEKFAKYETYLIKEISVIKEISFDGYMILLQDLIIVSREISGFVQSYGSIQNSLTAYVLGITDNYEFDYLRNFINFTPFTKKVKINIVISVFSKAGCVGYLKHKYPELVKKTTKSSAIFKDGLKVKFIDLDIDAQVDQDKLDPSVLKLIQKTKIL
jgi:hypothetical protein